MKHYSAFGLNIASSIDLTEVPTTSGNDTSVDLMIRHGSLPERLDSPILQDELCQITRSETLFDLSSQVDARFWIRNGQEIRVEKRSDRHVETIKLYLLGSCMGAILLQCGHLPLHGNTVLGPSGAVMFVGDIGAGKSTMTAAMWKRRHAIVADDLSTIQFNGQGIPTVEPGVPRLKLWADTLRYFDEDFTDLTRVTAIQDKYYLPLRSDFCTERQPLRTIYVLEPGNVDQPFIECLQGADKLDAIQYHLYKIGFRYALKVYPELFVKIGALANRVDVKVLRRPNNGMTIDQIADLIEADMANTNPPLVEPKEEHYGAD